jgi:phosphonate transport system substrate-binding protein
MLNFTLKAHAVIALCALFILTLIGGCKNSDLNDKGIPDKLLIGMYGGDNPAQTKAAIEPFRLYLQKKMGMEVELFFTTDYTAVIQALRSKKIQVAQLTPFAYVLATQKPGLTPIATLGIDGKPSLYHSIIITSPKTGIKSMNDVKLHAKDLTLCFADPASTSGHLIPRAYLTSIGLNPDNAFKEAIFAGSHAASILSVKSGKVDIGCTNIDLSLNKMIREGDVKKEDFVILWTSPPIINDAITVRNDLNKDFIKKIQNAYIDAAKDDYQAFNKYTKLYFPNTQHMAYISIQDSMYNGLRSIAGNIKQFKLSK